MATIAGTIFAKLVNMKVRPLNDIFIAGGRESTPFLDLIGGLNGLTAIRTDDELQFITGAEYELEAADASRLRTEAESAAGIAASATDDLNFKNGMQIVQESVEISDIALAQLGLTELNIEGNEALVESKLNNEINKKMGLIRRITNLTFLANQDVVVPTTSAIKGRTRGLSKVCELGTDTDGGASAITKDMVEQHVEDMVEDGALFGTPAIVCRLSEKRKLSKIYNLSANAGNVPTRNIAGQDLTQIVTESGITFVIVTDQDAPALELLFTDVEALGIVGLEVPGKGMIYSFSPSTGGASTKETIQGVMGLDHGPYRLHGRISNYLVPA